MRGFLGVLIVVELLGAALWFGGPPLDDWLQERMNPTLEAGPVQTEQAPTTLTQALRPGQVEVTGTLTRLTAEDAAGDAVPAPFTIQPAQVGVTRAIIANALVDRRPSTLSWDGGRPLPITGSGALQLGAAHLTVDNTGLQWDLQNAPRPFTPGTYRANFTLAVGSGGIASVRESPSFTATADTALEVTKGGAFVRLPAQATHVKSASTSLATLEGNLVVRAPDGTTRPVRRLSVNPGLFDITLTPGPGGFTVRAILQGPLEG